MKAVILEKLSSELAGGIDTEPKVLYLLAEIRKYIDQCSEKERKKYPNLYFYCNWVLHIRMDRTPAKRILNRFESILSGTKSLKEKSKIFISQEKDFYSFVKLKEELLGFFEINGLSTELLTNGYRWFKFKKLLVEILIDCPLINEEGRVKEFYYEKGDGGQIRFRVRIITQKVIKTRSFKVTLKEKYNRAVLHS